MNMYRKRLQQAIDALDNSLCCYPLHRVFGCGELVARLKKEQKALDLASEITDPTDAEGFSQAGELLRMIDPPASEGYDSAVESLLGKNESEAE